MMGTTIEWYDFFLYGTAAALVFNKIFFPAIDPISGTLAAFATYSVGFFARPLGGVVFGHFGDKVGRKSMLLITLFMMGIPTILIGLILLRQHRLLGRRAAGADALPAGRGGRRRMGRRHPDGRRARARRQEGLLRQPAADRRGAGPDPVLAGHGRSRRAARRGHAVLGWRIPFLASVVLLLVGWFIRAKVAESPDFERMREQGDKVEVPALVVLRRYPREVLIVVGGRLAEVTWFYTVVTFSLAYATGTLGIPRATMLDATVWGATLALFTMPLCGVLGDRIGFKWIFMAGAAGILLFAPMFFSMLQTRDPATVTTAVAVAVGLVYAALYGPQGGLFSAQFPPEVRYSGISLAVQVSGAIGGGLAPLVATSLLAYGGGDPATLSGT